MISEPSPSRSSTFHAAGGRRGAVRERRVLEILRAGCRATTSRPSYSASAGCASSAAWSSVSAWSPATTRRSPFCRSSLRLEHVHRRAADEAADEEVDRVVVQLLRRRHLLQLALAHHGDAVAHRHRLDLVVRDVDRGHAEVVLEPADLRAHLHAQLGVEVRERLVHQERLRLAHDRAAHRDPLALAAGERARLALEERSRARAMRAASLTRLVDLVLRHLLDLQAEGDVLVDDQVRVERVALEHHRDVAVARRDVVDDALADADDALGDRPRGRRPCAAPSSCRSRRARRAPSTRRPRCPGSTPRPPGSRPGRPCSLGRTRLRPRSISPYGGSENDYPASSRANPRAASAGSSAGRSWRTRRTRRRISV